MRWLAVMALLLVGCAEEDAIPRCTPGASLPCACADGTSGAQLCQSDGTLAPCACTANAETPSPPTPAPPPPTPSPPTPAPPPLAPAPTPAPIAAAPGTAGCVSPPRDAAERAGAATDGPAWDPADAMTERVDTDGDGTMEFVVAFPDFCGNAPSCRHWVYTPADGPCQRFVREWERTMYEE